MSVMIIKPIVFPNFSNQMVYFYPGDIVKFDTNLSIAYGKGIHFNLLKTEYSLIN